MGDDISWVLNGGHALELRLQKSRATKDVDLAMKDEKGNNKREDIGRFSFHKVGNTVLEVASRFG